MSNQVLSSDGIEGQTAHRRKLKRSFLVTLVAVATLSLSMMASPSETLARPTTDQDGLVNVAVGDITLRDINVGLAAQIVANLCGAQVQNVAVLALAVDQTGAPQTVDCDAAGAPVTIEQNTDRGNGNGNNGRAPGQVHQDGLVNVAIGDITLRDINVGVAAQIVANVCGLQVQNVALIAAAVDQTGAPQTVTCEATGAPITITQNLPGRGH